MAQHDNERDRAHERLVRAAVAENPTTAELIRDTLAEAGIRSMVKNCDNLSVVYGGVAAGPWSLEVWVLEGDAAAAAAILGGTPAPPLPPPAVTAPPRRRRWWHRWGRN